MKVRSIEVQALKVGDVFHEALYLYLEKNGRYIAFLESGSSLEATWLEKLKQFQINNVYLQENLSPQTTEKAASPIDAISPLEKTPTEVSSPNSQPNTDSLSEPKTADLPHQPSAPISPEILTTPHSKPEPSDHQRPSPMPQAPLPPFDLPKILPKARQGLSQLGHSDPAVRKMGLQLCQSLLEEIAHPTPSLADLWKQLHIESPYSHSTRVASFAVSLALMMGETDPRAILILTWASLLHEVGALTAWRTPPWKMQPPRRSRESLETLFKDAAVAPWSPKFLIPYECLSLVELYMEKFDGSGPLGLEHWQHPRAREIQILSAAHILDEWMTGWRQESAPPLSLHQSLEELTRIETSRLFPEYFDPEFFQELKQVLSPSSRDEFLLTALATSAETVDPLLKTLDEPQEA